MKTLFLSLCVAATVTAAPVPPALPAIPVVKRPPILKSPKHAAVVKDAPMRVASVGDPGYSTRLPMEGSYVWVTNDYGTKEFTASAMQPANNSILFEVGATSLGPWEPLAYWGPQPLDQKTFASLYSYADYIWVRANVTPVISTMRQTGWMPASLVPASGGNYYINPMFKAKGARAWAVRK